ncbi:MAG TPA: dienelactone hydrolase family protein [Ktedonobacteraceae bacterium]|nr:dienelactone hydrolase family protein [Ktedonobacteraceae bacterium]
MTQETSMTSFHSGRRQLDGYIARPEGDGPFPGIVVIHEILGLNENMKDITRRFAEQGYIALAVDLFAGGNRAICMFRVMAGALLNPLHNGGVHDLKAALTFLSEQPGVDVSRLGAVGYCLGGSFAVAWACTDERLKVIAPYYATNPRPLKAVARLCPVVGSYPDKDFTTSAGRKLDVELERYQVPHDIKIYSGAKHSFFNDTIGNYNESAAQDSWRRVLAFFEEHLSANVEG